MEKDLAERAQELLIRIRRAQDKIEELEKRHGWNFSIVTARHKNELLIPKELQDTVFTLIRAAYVDELNELENELKEL